MKTADVSFKMLVPDDFEPGQCKKCPLKLVEGHETANRTWEETVSCRVGLNKIHCPIRMEKE